MSRRKLVPVLTLVLPCIALAGCNREPTLEDKVVGTWEESRPAGKMIITLRADHVVEIDYDVAALGKGLGTGKWSIEDTMLFCHITESDNAVLKDMNEVIEIVSVDDTQLVYRDPNGELKKRVRRKE